MIRTNYSDGYIVQYEELCFDSWLLIPAETFWAKWLRGCLYTIAILYLFLGIAIAADVFMLSIEMITSKKRIIFTYDFKKKERVQREVFIWNETIANLTLMALGSSAPEILIAVFETLSSLDDVESKDALGIFTIIGSASYNLLVISAVCIISVPSNTIKYISEFGVFIITSIWSMFAYFWLLVVLRWSSPNEIEIWEAVLTFLFFPMLVITAWCQDKGWWIYKCIKSKIKEQINYSDSFVHSPPITINSSHLVDTENAHPSLHSRSETKTINVQHQSHHVENDVGKQINSTMSRAFARARFRHAVVISMTGNVTESNRNTKPISKRNSIPNLRMTPVLELTDIRDIKSGTFCFASSTYSFPRKTKIVEIDVLFNKHCRKQSCIGFSHVVEVARKRSMIFNDGNHVQTVFHKPIEDDQISLPNVNNLVDGCKRTNPNTPNKSLSKETISITEVLPNNNGHASPLNKLEVVSKPDNNGSLQRNSISLVNNSMVLSKLSNMQNVFWIHYETREGNAKDGKDFQANSGLLLFTEEEYTKKISIPLYTSDDGDDSEVKDFYVVLKDPCQDTTISGPSITHVYLLQDNEPSEFVFEEATYHIQMTSSDSATATAKVIRLHGNDGKATLYYRTINGTAIGGNEIDLADRTCDYGHIEEGILNFQPGQTSHKIVIKINPRAERGKTFIIALYHVTGCGRIGRRSAAIISLTTEADEIVDQITSQTNNDGEQQHTPSLTKSWKTQFEEQDKCSVIASRFQFFARMFSVQWRCALHLLYIFSIVLCLLGTESAVSMEKSPSCGAILLHFLCFFWKVLLAFIPPRTVLGGWMTFVVSLMTLGIMSALIEQFAKLLGCVIGLHVSVTGITLVALGTSMPDTFASKTAAEQDETADAAIGNITGSNSVNVFLGLGLPWMIKSMYLHTKGQKLRLENANLTSSLVIFLSVGFITLILLVVRRKLFKGELGGPVIPKIICGCILIFFWFVFITLSSLQAYKVIEF